MMALQGEYESSRLHFILSMRQDTSNTMAYSYLGGCEVLTHVSIDFQSSENVHHFIRRTHAPV